MAETRNLCNKAPIAALGSTQPPTHWTLIVLFPGLKQLECEASTYLYLVLKLRMYGAIPLLPHVPSWHGARLSTGIHLSLRFIGSTIQ
jgi:hypothetical protein